MDDEHQQYQQMIVVKSPLRVVLMCTNIISGAINVGYCLTYMSLSINTLFLTLYLQLGINSDSDKTKYLSLVNGIYPLGCFFGVLLGQFLLHQITTKQCIILSDIICLTTVIMDISNIGVIIAFRFVLGISGGMSTYFGPIYIKAICPDQYYHQISMLISYGMGTGALLGSVSGIGYITYHSSDSNWWRVVFVIPAVLSILRTFIILTFYNYDNPEQLLLKNKEEQCRLIMSDIYTKDSIDLVIDTYKQKAEKHALHKTDFVHIFNEDFRRPLSVGIITVIEQTWGGSFAVIYFSAQIFQTLVAGDLQMLTTYTILVGLVAFCLQFLAIPLLHLVGQKNLLIFGSLFMAIICYCITIISKQTETQYLTSTVILNITLLGIYSASIGPVGWGIVPQINDSQGTLFIMEVRWLLQVLLVFVFPYMKNSIQMEGIYSLFGCINILYVFYSVFKINESRGLTAQEIQDSYRVKYKSIQSLPE